MARKIEIECRNCRHIWTLDLDEHQDKIIIYRGTPDEPPTLDSYSFSCPNCGKANVIEVPRKGGRP